MEIESLLAGSDGSLWIGTDGRGITRYQGGVFVTLDSVAGLQGDSGKALYEDATGKLWIGTWNGLVRVHGDQGVRLGQEAGLPSDAIPGRRRKELTGAMMQPPMNRSARGSTR